MKLFIRSVRSWEHGDLLDTADTLAGLLGCDLDVALVSPSSAPGVSDDVVVNATLVSVTNCCDCMV